MTNFYFAPELAEMGQGFLIYKSYSPHAQKAKSPKMKLVDKEITI
jgi:hypothetical protein